MTVPTEISRSGPYAGAGTTGPFTVTFRFLSNSHLQVIRTSTTGVDTTLVLSTDYTVTGAGGTSGTVTLIVALAVGEELTIIRDVPFTQEADYVNGDSFPAESHEDALDLLTMQTQQLKDGLDRSLTLPATAIDASTELPAPEASTLIGWNATGDALQNYDADSLGVAIATSSWYTELFDGTGAQTDFILGVDAGVASNCDVIVNNVPQVAGINFSYAPSTQTVSFLTGAPTAGTNNVVVRHGQALAAGTIGSTGITDSTVVGRSVLTAANAAAARTALAVTPANIGAAEAGANDDITSLDGLTSPIPRANTISKIESLPNPTLSANAMTLPASTHAQDFRSATLSDGLPVTVTGTAAALTIPAGATLVSVSDQQSTIVEVILNNAGTLEKAVVNIAGGNDLSETGVISTTAISAGATAANVFYSNTARTGVAYKVVRTITSTQATAGQWATTPSLVQGAGGNALDSMQSLGYGQTWQVVTGSRVLGTTYYNTTGRPIQVGASAQSATVNSTMTLTVNGATALTNSSPDSGISVTKAVISAIIPVGASYSINMNNTPTLIQWSELR